MATRTLVMIDALLINVVPAASTGRLTALQTSVQLNLLWKGRRMIE